MAESPHGGRLRGALVAGAVGLAIAALVGVYPLALDAALAGFGVRAVALALLALGLATLPLRSAAPRTGPVAALGLAAILLAAAIGEDRVFLRLVPAWIYGGLAWTFAASLRRPESLIETGARWLVPAAPDFIGDYCRVITALWAGFFVASGAVVTGLAIAGSPADWRAFTGRDLWLAMALLSVVEFFVRKTWFRYYYHGGPFERFWSAVFPAERTARGRQSLAYIREYKAKLRDLEMKLSDPNAKLSDLEMKLSDPNAKLRDLEMKLSDPKAKLRDPERRERE